MASSSVSDQRNEIIFNELKHIVGSIEEVKLRLNGIVNEIGTLRSSEISDLKGDIKVLKDRAGRNGAIAGSIGGILFSSIVTLIMQLLLHSK